MRGLLWLVATFVFSTLGELPVHAGLDGNIWLKTSDDFKVGYSVGIMDALRVFAPDEKPLDTAPERYEQMWYLHHCGIKKELTWPQVQAAIDGYIRNHPNERTFPLVSLAVIALTTLCGPSP